MPTSRQPCSILTAGLTICNTGTFASCMAEACRTIPAGSFGRPALAALLAGADDPLAVAERLQIPHRQHRLLRQFMALRERLAAAQDTGGWPPSRWCVLLEAPGGSAEAVALALCWGFRPRRPLMRWWCRWRHIRPGVSAADLIASGLAPGPL